VEKRLRGDVSFPFKLGDVSLQKSVKTEKIVLMKLNLGNETWEAGLNTVRRLNV